MIDEFTDMPVFFTGVVEDVLDPEEMGRAKVRCFGFHTDNRTLIPTDSLPWAWVLTPVTNPAMTGIGTSSVGLLNGTWVFGFFRDGKSAQDPVIIGSLPSRNNGRDSNLGFSDPNGVYPHREGSIDQPLPSTAAFTEAYSYLQRFDTRQTQIEKAIGPNLTTVDPDAKEEERTTWDIPNVEDTTAPVYPNNKSTVTESGHCIEVDDTTGSERISVMHRTGTYQDFISDGSEIKSVRKDRYTVVFGDDSLYIKGSVNITVDGDVRTLVKGNHILEVEGDLIENIKGSRKTKIGGSSFLEVDFDLAENISGEFSTHIGSNRVEIIDADSVSVIGKKSNRSIGESESVDIGKDSITSVAANSKTLVNGDLSDSVLGSRNVNTAGVHNEVSIVNRNIKVGSSINMISTADMLFGCGGSLTETIKGSQTTNVTGAVTLAAGPSVTVTADTINLNPSE